MRVHHVAFRSADPKRLAEFYRRLFLLSVAKSDPTIWLTSDSGDTVLMIEPREASEPTMASGSMELVAWSIRANERRFWKERLLAAGIPVEAETAYSIYFRDPEGRRVAVSHYPEIHVPELASP